MDRNRLRATLDQSAIAAGRVILFSRTPEIVRMAAAAGYDFVWLDTLHSTLSLETVGDMCAMARACGVTPLVRPYAHSPEYVGRLLDGGAMGLIYTDVRTRAQVERFQSWMRYPPSGTRSACFSAATDHADLPAAELMRMQESDLLLGVQVETAAAVEGLSRLLDGGGVDLVQIGRQDLCIELGVPNDLTEPALRQAVGRVVDICDAFGAAVVAGGSGPDEIDVLVALGVRCVHFQNDYAVLMAKFRSDLAALRSRPPIKAADSAADLLHGPATDVGDGLDFPAGRGPRSDNASDL